jgi:hypothetical protein
MNRKLQKLLAQKAWLSGAYLVLAIYFIIAVSYLLPYPGFHSPLGMILVVLGIVFYLKNFISGAFVYPISYRKYFDDIENGNYVRDPLGLLYKTDFVSEFKKDGSELRGVGGTMLIIAGSILGINFEIAGWKDFLSVGYFGLVLIFICIVLIRSTKTSHLFRREDLKIDFSHDSDKNLANRHSAESRIHPPAFVYPKGQRNLWEGLTAKAYRRFLQSWTKKSQEEITEKNNAIQLGKNSLSYK